MKDLIVNYIHPHQGKKFIRKQDFFQVGKLTKEQRIKIVDDYLNTNKSIVELANEYKVAIYTIQYHLNKAKVSIDFREKKRVMNSVIKRKMWYDSKDGLEFRKRRSIFMSKKNPSVLYGSPMKGKKHSAETRNKIKIGIRNAYLNGFQGPWKGKRRDEKTMEKLRKARLQLIMPKKDTKIEKMMAIELKNRGILFEKNKSLLDICQPDFQIIGTNVVVQCDGDYWHKLPYIVEKDLRQDKLLKEYGFFVLRFWEHKIIKDVKSCVDEIENSLYLTNNALAVGVI